MKPIVESKGVKLYCPQDGRFSFFNSPYPSHKENSGVDIYPNCGFGGVAPSPVDGEVIMIRRVKAPRGHGFEAADHDTVVLIQNRDNPETVTKILHIDPLVNKDDSVKKGESIGVTLRSGYYGWGTSPHIHAEVRSPSDPIRARGGYKLALIDVPYSGPLEEIAGEVVHIQPEFAFIKLNTKSIGLVGTVNGEPATLDGGIPYYGWLGAHIRDAP
jgi:murein DD-endopeptidase MepM/ murein hydrolase activator NlpD